MSASTRVIFVLRDGLPETAGNRTTAERLAAGLSARGVEVAIREAGQLRALPGRPTIYHALHALGSGPAALACARRDIDPVVVTLTGTDAGEGPSPALSAVLERCDAVVTFHPDPVADATVIPPGVASLAGRRDRPAWDLAPGDVVFLLPAGVRPVKDPAFALAPLADLRASGRPIRLVIVGPARDQAATDDLCEQLRAAGPWASYLGELPHTRMGSLYRSADIVLNTSRIEGLSNAVLEAMACGRPVLVSDIPGNRAAVTTDRTGLLYAVGDPADFRAQAERLVDDHALRRRLGRAAARHVRTRFAPEAEIDRLLALYANLSQSLRQAPARI